ncbi:uncharacterized protein isoform X1 [Rhodnius prolixus]|uniref:uncharacterized protein isoform X1 n=1 Tax=Rhodnius prolixus TaxID=13249 RepID=UPI003D18EB50
MEEKLWKKLFSPMKMRLLELLALIALILTTTLLPTLWEKPYKQAEELNNQPWHNTTISVVYCGNISAENVMDLIVEAVNDFLVQNQKLEKEYGQEVCLMCC